MTISTFNQKSSKSLNDSRDSSGPVDRVEGRMNETGVDRVEGRMSKTEVDTSTTEVNDTSGADIRELDDDKGWLINGINFVFNIINPNVKKRSGPPHTSPFLSPYSTLCTDSKVHIHHYLASFDTLNLHVCHLNAGLQYFESESFYWMLFGLVAKT